jgi:hypothetical protein
VRRYGTYGQPGARRQLYQCLPDNASKHTFAGVLPRRMLGIDTECDACETHLASFEGPPTPRHFHFSVREAAQALYDVAQGNSYTSAAQAAWRHAGQRANGRRQSQLVANWVETLTPIATEHLKETSWPETIVCDSMSYQLKNKGGRRGRRKQVFAVLAVWGYPANSPRGRLWALTASHSATKADWVKLFDTLPGTPDLVVCDGAKSISGAVKAKWPLVNPPAHWPEPAAPFIYRCEHHLSQNAFKALKRLKLESDAPLMVALRDAFKSPAQWAHFRSLAAAHVGIAEWCRTNDKLIKCQSAWRANLPPHRANGAVEAALQVVKAATDYRSLVLGNKYRTNQMLELVMASINGQADVDVFARALRTGLRNGAVTQPQLTCVDKGTRTRKVNGVLAEATNLPSLRR